MKKMEINNIINDPDYRINFYVLISVIYGISKEKVKEIIEKLNEDEYSTELSYIKASVKHEYFKYIEEYNQNEVSPINVNLKTHIKESLLHQMKNTKYSYGMRYRDFSFPKKQNDEKNKYYYFSFFRFLLADLGYPFFENEDEDFDRTQDTNPYFNNFKKIINSCLYLQPKYALHDLILNDQESEKQISVVYDIDNVLLKKIQKSYINLQNEAILYLYFSSNNKFDEIIENGLNELEKKENIGKGYFNDFNKKLNQYFLIPLIEALEEIDKRNSLGKTIKELIKLDTHLHNNSFF